MSKLSTKTLQLGSSATLSQNFAISVPAVQDGSMTIKREDGTALLTIGANGKWVAPGLVGTVSQSGGVPTGQIIETGSNANGQYVRFADGTQICMQVQGFSGIAIAYGQIFTSEEGDWTFPAAFVSAPHYTGAQGRQFGGTWAGSGAGAVTATACSFNFLRATSYVGTFSGHLLAVGRWY